MPHREWIKHVDPEKVTLYPLQFANCERLRKNDVVYIFDEVGCGKTISSGIMALDYLEHNPDKAVLVVTVNALVKSKKNKGYGAFLDKWYEKLPFGKLEYKAAIGSIRSITTANYFNIIIVNNNCASFKSKMKYGLVIIDEAHIFLNPKTDRYKNLVENVRADKVVFLTATPIKSSPDDLAIYTEIANNILGKKIGAHIDTSWMAELFCANKEPKELICSTFNPYSPVTRYFKDTIQNLTIDNYEKIKRQRAMPQIWYYKDSENKKRVALLENINRILENEKESKFVVFVHKVPNEAHQLADFLEQNGFTMYPKNNFLLAVETCHDTYCPLKSYAVVTGDNSYDLEKYSCEVGVPTVLILTYQIAEQGVDLPGYNYVINYHISAFPSSLEQRFGRIDRLDGVLKNEKGEVLPKANFEKINMCFLVAENVRALDNTNFNKASYGYAKDIFSLLPSRNSFFTRKIMTYLSDKAPCSYADDYKEKLKAIFKNTPLQKLRSCLLEKDNDTFTPEIEFLADFLEGNNIEFAKNDSNESFTEKIKEALDAELDYEDITSYKEIKDSLSENSDDIFYITRTDENSHQLKTISTTDCYNNIRKNKNYIDYVRKFKKNVEIPLLLNKYKIELKSLNECYEQEFNNSNFTSLFTFEGIRNVFGKFLETFSNAIDKKDKETLLLYAEVVVSRLPLYEMFDTYKSILFEYIYTAKGGKLKEKYNYSPFFDAKYAVKNKIDTGDLIGLSDSFIQCNFSKNVKFLQQDTYFILKPDDTDNTLLYSSPWLKLAYWCTRREELCLAVDLFPVKVLSNNENIFRQREQCLRYISLLYTRYEGTPDILGNMEAAFRESQVYKSSESKPTLKEAAKVTLGKKWGEGKYRSVFKYFAFNWSEKQRVSSPNIFPLKREIADLKIQEGDIWTAGIYYEIYGQFTGECKWGDILNLPEDYKNMTYLWEEGRID